jgi:MoxR-like ATPase
MRDVIEAVVSEVGRVLLGKEEKIKLAVACILSDGHLLIEDLPGMGKTTLSQALSRVFGLDYQRIQFTSDMLPADIIGFSIFDAHKNEFIFHPGPIFTQVLLADEINRTTPKTQSALLEAMEERQVTCEGETRKLSQPFFVIATQNPQSQMGTYPLPESQLDRFLMRISLGYPDEVAERQLFLGGDPRQHLEQLKICMTPDQLRLTKEAVAKIKTSDSLIAYLQRLVHFTRTDPDFPYGLSPRGAMALLRAAKTWAFMHGRAYVVPEDIQTLLPVVTAHRVAPTSASRDQLQHPLIIKLLTNVDIIAD